MGFLRTEPGAPLNSELGPKYLPETAWGKIAPFPSSFSVDADYQGVLFDLRLGSVGDTMTEVADLLCGVVENDIGWRSTWRPVFGKLRWSEDTIGFRSDGKRMVVLVVIVFVPVMICGWDLTTIESAGSSHS